MSAACALLVSMVCFRGPVKQKHEESGLWRSDTMSAPGFKARIFRGDQLLSPDWRQLSEACFEDACVRYHKHCLTTPGEVHCTYSYAWPADDFLHTLEVSADSPENYAAAERAIGLVPPDRPESKQILLALLGIASALEAAPTCPSRTECWP